jgi:V/A-type H+/Na+-transporting ATPase subunit I
MAIAKMKLVNIVGRLKDFDTVVQSCCLHGDFHPEQSSIALNDVEEFIPIDDFNPYMQSLQKAVDTGVHSDIPLHFSSFDSLALNDAELEDYIDKTEAEVGVLDGNVRNLAQEIARLEQGITQLTHLRSLKISLDDVFSCKFFHFRFGRLPKDSYPKLELCDESEDAFFFPLEEDKEYYWGFYVALEDVCEKIDQLFSSLYFERINIIEEAHGTPDQAVAAVRKTLAEKTALYQDAKAAVAKYWQDNRDRFLIAYSKIKYLADSFDLRKYASKCSDNFYIFGWVPEKDTDSFSKKFEDLPDVDCVIESTEEAENVEPPTHLVNNPVSKPFENYVEMYGLPSYNEIDPTPFMSITYAVIFGIMFGDLGQGFLILLASLFMKYKKKMFLGDIMIRCSIFSMIFGALYNSVFGYEDILPFTVLPVHENKNIMIILGTAIGLGILLILGCMVLNIVNGVKQKNLEKVFFSQNGVAGFVFYASLITGLVLMLLVGKNIMTLPFILLLIILPIIIIYFKEPLGRLLERKKELIPGSKGEYFITAFFEMFEILLSFLSNTVSYVRIGAFILSHSAMMTAVFVIGGVLGNSNNPIVLIIGNLFVIALEGLIVGIQGLRLQFYEMFSRFYDGGGKSFEPAKIKYDI